MVQPEAAADIPAGPVSWYGVARPWALSGLPGTTMSHDTLAAAAAAVAAADAVAVGQMTGVAVADAVAPAAVGAVVVGAAVAVIAADWVAAAGTGEAALVAPAAVVAGVVLSGAAVLAWVPACAAVPACVLVVGAADDAPVAAAVTGVAQSPATLAVLLALPNTFPSPGAMSRATPTPITTATTPTIATSLRRDRPEPQLSG
jgi:hypothetical protein